MGKDHLDQKTADGSSALDPESEPLLETATDPSQPTTLTNELHEGDQPQFEGLTPRQISIGFVLAILIGLAGLFFLRETRLPARYLIDMAVLYRLTGQTGEGVRLLDEAMAAGIRDHEMLGKVGEEYRLLRDYNKSISTLQRALGKNPNNQVYLLSLARSFVGAGRNQEALDTFEHLVELDPANIGYYMELASAHLSLNQPDQALLRYQEAIEVDPTNLNTWSTMADVYRLLSQYDEAIAAYHQVLQLDPDHFASRLNIGLCYLGKRDFRRALDTFLVAAMKNPGRPEPYYHMGETYLAQGLFSQAREPYGKAIELDDRYYLAYIGLGKVNLFYDDCTEAAVNFSLALSLNPNNAEALEGLEACAGDG
jgi:tetratricopeptide (TPR) repeat protein